MSGEVVRRYPAIGRSRMLADGTKEKLSEGELCRVFQEVQDRRGYMVIAVDVDDVKVGDVLTPNVENVTVKVIAKTDIEDLKAEKAAMGEKFRGANYYAGRRFFRVVAE